MKHTTILLPALAVIGVVWAGVGAKAETIPQSQDQVATAPTRAESVVRTRLADGSYIESSRSTTTTRTLAPNVTEKITDVVELDVHGQKQTMLRTREVITKDATGEHVQLVKERRDPSGRFGVERDVTATTVRAADGSLQTHQIEKTRDVNGNIIPSKEVDEMVVTQSPTEKLITRKVGAFSHVEGRFGLSAQESETVRLEGDTTHIERIVRTPSGSTWTVSGKTETTEKRAPDGSIQRVTIEQGPGLYTTRTGTDTEPLVPLRKIVERETRQTDGTTVTEREFYRRNVNGEWQREVQPTPFRGEK
jgi:hypothetical protein